MFHEMRKSSIPSFSLHMEMAFNNQLYSWHKLIFPNITSGFHFLSVFLTYVNMISFRDILIKVVLRVLSGFRNRQPAFSSPTRAATSTSTTTSSCVAQALPRTSFTSRVADTQCTRVKWRVHETRSTNGQSGKAASTNLPFHRADILSPSSRKTVTFAFLFTIPLN